jgi:microcystin-dependent protein
MSGGFNIRNQNQFSFSDLTANLKFIDTIELGYQPNKTNSGAHSIAIGTQTGLVNQGTYGIAIGFRAGQYIQGSNAIALGLNAGQTSQGSNAIAIGELAGNFGQKPFSVAIGTDAGQFNQATSAIAIGSNAGYTNQRENAITIGFLSGYNNQGTSAVALGSASGQSTQGAFAVAIGSEAGQINQGQYSVAIGSKAGKTNQAANSIILNASGNVLNSSTSGLFANPIRTEESGSDIDLLVYNNGTSEITRESFPYNFGDYKYSLLNTDHDNWLLCNGRSLLVAQYPLLFAIIGYSFGGSGANFNLPDPRSRVLGLIGQGPGLSNRTLGQNVGAETHTLTTNEMPAHNHTINDPGHNHTYQAPITNQAVSFGPFTASDDVSSIQNTSLSTTGITINNTGGGLAHNIMQPTLFIGNLFIYS